MPFTNILVDRNCFSFTTFTGDRHDNIRTDFTRNPRPRRSVLSERLRFSPCQVANRFDGRNFRGLYMPAHWRGVALPQVLPAEQQAEVNEVLS